jgi:cellulose synthase (UDP-forming)
MSAHRARSRAVDWQQPVLVSSSLPAPETRRRRFAIRLIALAALASSAVYLTWRGLATLDLAVWWLAVPLFLLEVHAALGLALFTFSLWDVDRRPVGRDVAFPPGRVAVLIPTYNEGIEVLTPTIAAALAMRVEHETWVLDDGDRPAVAELARELGAHYLARPDHAHAKAGNLNHALGVIDAEYVAVLDADHVGSPDFLLRTLGYFDDPAVALVQTPQDFYNSDSFEHAEADRDGHHEQALFYRVLQPGKNRWQAAFWCGTGAVIRVSALRDVGGVATETITEDIHTTIRLHRRGWRTVYHNEVLARGLAAGDAATYQAQRLRWGTGAMQVLRVENPLVVAGLSTSQRLAYAATLLGWFDAWRTLGYLVLPIAVVLTGASPIHARPEVFFPAFAITFVLQQLALRVLSRGFHRPILSTVFELVRMNANLRATLTLVRSGRPSFQVTPKGRLGDARSRTPAPAALWLVAMASIGAGAWFIATSLGLTVVRYPQPWAVDAAAAWLAVNGALVALAILRIRALRYAPERRASVRFALTARGTFGERPVEIADLSLTGARIRAEGRPGALEDQLTFVLAGEHLALDCSIRTATPDAEGSWDVGLEFVPGQLRERARLALAIFTARQQSQHLTEPLEQAA